MLKFSVTVAVTKWLHINGYDYCYVTIWRGVLYDGKLEVDKYKIFNLLIFNI